jgi:uncharacterized protein HemX
MKINSTCVLVVCGVLSLPISVSAGEQDSKQKQTQQKEQVQAQDQEAKMIYGWELMTVKEREEHRNKMRSFKTEEERTAYRQEHHKKMQQRAKEKGVTIPDEPRERGSGAGPGGGQGTGSGRGNM